MADGYWRYSDPRAPPPPTVSGPPAAAAAAGPPSSSAPPLKRPRPDFPGERLPDWRYSDHRIPAGAPPVPPPSSDPLKRSRADYPDMPGGRDLPPYYPSRDEDRQGFRVVRDTEAIGASYDRYLRNGLPSAVSPEPSRAGGIVGYHPMDDRRVIGGRQEAPRLLSLPPDASNTLYVEGLPSNCTSREVSHIFRPFVGYREVRLVSREAKHKDGSTHVLCFVDFSGPAQAAVALDALQGIMRIEFRSSDPGHGDLRIKNRTIYHAPTSRFVRTNFCSASCGPQFSGHCDLGYRLDEHDRDSPVLRLQFARNPGLRSGGSRSRR